MLNLFSLAPFSCVETCHILCVFSEVLHYGFNILIHYFNILAAWGCATISCYKYMKGCAQEVRKLVENITKSAKFSETNQNLL